MTTERPSRTLADVFVAASPDRRYDLGRVALPPEVLRRNAAAVVEIERTLAKVYAPQIAELHRTVQRIIETTYAPQIQAAIRQIAAQIDTRAIAAALRQFQGDDWARLGQRLSVAVQPPTVQATAQEHTPTIIADPVVPADEPASRPDLLVDSWRYIALLAAALYFINFTAAQVVFTDPDDLLAELRDNAAYAIAMYGALRFWGQKRGYK